MLTKSFAEITSALLEPHFLLAQDGSILSANKAAKKNRRNEP